MTADAGKAPADRLNYRHCFDGLFRIVREEGVGQLFRGLGPNLVRAVLMNASQLVSYDWFKQELMTRGGMQDGLLLHSAASLGAGTVATSTCSVSVDRASRPDSVPRLTCALVDPDSHLLPCRRRPLARYELCRCRSRAYHRLQPAVCPGSSVEADHAPTVSLHSTAQGPITVLTQSLKAEGPGFLFRGWTPAWMRLAPNTVLMYVPLPLMKDSISFSADGPLFFFLSASSSSSSSGASSTKPAALFEDHRVHQPPTSPDPLLSALLLAPGALFGHRLAFQPHACFISARAVHLISPVNPFARASAGPTHLDPAGFDRLYDPSCPPSPSCSSFSLAFARLA
jgi:hypothetical protein